MKILSLWALVVAITACGGGGTGPSDDPLPGTGSVEVTLDRAPGAPALMFSVSVRVGNGSPTRIQDGQVETFSGIAAGTHVIEATDPTPSCSIQGETSKTVSIAANQVTRVSFQVTCTFNREPRIAFVWRKDAEVYDIFTVRPDGTDLQQLTQNGSSQEPSWSPDGTRIAYSGEGGIWAMNFDGAEQRKIFDERGFAPAWSPDGIKIAFTGGTANSSVIVVRNVDGSNRVVLTGPPGFSEYPAWSHNGQKIAYCENMDVLMVMNADGTDPVALASGNWCRTPTWSPDDQEIAFDSLGETEWQIWRIGVDGSGLSRLTLNSFRCTWPDYLPDGSAIVYHCLQAPTESRAWIMERDGGNQRRLTAIPWVGARQVCW